MSVEISKKQQQPDEKIPGPDKDKQDFLRWMPDAGPSQAFLAALDAVGKMGPRKLS